MDLQRISLYGALFLVSLLLWSAWQKDYPVVAAPTAVVQHVQQTPLAANASQQTVLEKPAHQTFQSIPQQRLVRVRTDVLDVAIDTLGGGIVKANLLDYPDKLNSSKSFALFNDNPESQYFAQIGLTGLSGRNVKQGMPVFSSHQESYKLKNGAKELGVTLTSRTNGLQITKHYKFQRGSYLINVTYDIQNQSRKIWSGQVYTQLVRKPPTGVKKGMFYISSYTGASISDPANKIYQKIHFKDMDKKNVNQVAKGGWAAMQQHYFLSAWVPPSKQMNRYYSRVNNGLYTIGMTGPELNLASGHSLTTNAKLYVGPEVAKNLKDLAPGLDLTVDYGWLWFISSALFWLLSHIYSVVGNWGWSIVLVTVLIKLGFYRLSASSYKSMANMRKLQPKIESLKERYGDDKQQMSQSMMALYKKEKINPLGGCLPILVQIPVFIALYYVLLESVELRHAPFILWIHDLSAPDPYYILPVVMGISMFVQQKLNPPPPDPTQAKVMMFLPVMFTFLFLHFPSGLVLYWVVNNLLSIAQQWYITRGIELAGKPSKA